MQSKTFAKRTIAASIWVVAFVSISFGSAYAAWQSYSSTMSTWVGQTSAQCSTDGELFADNGDVVTTNKWNNLSCHVRNMWYQLTDGMRGKTYFMRGRNDTSTSPAGFVVEEINLPLTSSGNIGGAINFKDPDLGYGVSSAWKGGIQWRNTDQSIVMFSPGGVRLSGNPTDPYSYKLVGWEKVNLLDDLPFDTQCQYRIKSTSGQYLYPTVRGELLSVMEDDNWADNISSPIHIQVFASAQQSMGGKTNLKQSYPNGTMAYPHGNVAMIEKFCLNSYNPNSY